MRDLKYFGFILFIIVLIVAVFQWFLLKFTHWSVPMIVTEIIGFFILAFYVSLTHARPNGGNGSSLNSEYIAPTVLVVTSLLLGMWLVSLLSKKQVPNLAFIVGIGLMFVFAVGRNL